MYRNRLAFALAMAVLAAILVPSTLTAQITFQRTYGDTGDDWGYSVRQTADGGYVIAGSTNPFSSDYTDARLIRTDANGDTMWTRTYGGAHNDESFSVLQTPDSGFIIVGYSSPSAGDDGDVYLVRTNAAGETLWTRTYGGADYDVGSSIRPTSDGGYIIAGHTWSFGAGSADVYLSKTDANGDTVWTRTLGGTQLDAAHAIQQATDGGYVIAGDSKSFGAGGYDVYLIKTDANGDTTWTKTYGGAGYDYGYSVVQATDGGYMVVGYTSSFGAGGWDCYLIKTDSIGDTLWTRTYGGAQADYGYSVQQTSDGCYIIAGYTNSFGAGNADVYLIKTDAGGDTMWTMSFGGDGDDHARSVQRAEDEGYIIAGWTTSFGAGREDVYLIKTDSLGNVAVAEPKTSPTRAPALSLSCEPNPFRTRTAISLQLTADSPAEVTVFDAGGRRVRTLTVNRTPYTVWNGTDELGYALPSGTYFAVLAAAGQHATTRIVLQR